MECSYGFPGSSYSISFFQNKAILRIVAEDKQMSKDLGREVAKGHREGSVTRKGHPPS